MFTHFKNNQFRRYLLAFASIFSNVVVTREDNTGLEVQRIVVPVEYGPKERWFTRLTQDPTLTLSVSSVLPRMTFEVNGISWDSSRKLNSMNSLNFPSPDLRQQHRMYVGVPYNLSFQLDILTKLQQDGLQIVEQIMPFFTPDLTMAISVIPELGIVDEVPLSLLSVSHSDNYEGDFEHRRVVLWTMNFSMKVNFYGPRRRASRIEQVMVNIHNERLADILDPPELLRTEDGSVLTTEDQQAFVTEATPDAYTDEQGTAEIVVTADPLDQDPAGPITANTVITEHI